MKYYCLTLPKRLTKREAVEEIFREQQAYDRKFSNLGSRSGYVFSLGKISILPKKLFNIFLNSSIFRILKYEYHNGINSKINSADDFIFIISTNKQFITWITLKLVEIENKSSDYKIIKNIDQKLVRYQGMMCEIET